MRFARSVFCMLLVLALSVGFAVAEETEDKYVVDGEETVLIDRDDFRLYLTGEYESNDNVNGVSGNFMSHLSCVVENKGDEEIGSISYSGVINGWSLGSSHVMSSTNGVRPGTKAKADIWFTTEDTEVTSYEDLETMELTFEVKDEDYDTMFEVSTGVVHFHATPEDAAATVEETAVEAEEETVVEPEEAASDEAPAAEQQAEETESTVEEETYDTLEIGSRGDAVVELQKYLIALGYLDGAADGIYGKGTAGGVSRFQKAEGMEETGIADSQMQNRLFSKELPKKPDIAVLPVKLTVNSAGTPELYVRFRNDTTETIDRLDFHVECYNTYDERIIGYGRYEYSDNYYEADPQNYYSGTDIEPGETTANDWYWGLYGFDGTTRVRIAVYKYHTTTGNTVNIPESDWIWVDLEQ